MILELIEAAALLLALSLLQGLIVRFWRHQRILQQLLSGLLFGLICVVGMLMPIEVTPGVIFDPRSVVLASAGLFGGPVVASVAALIAGAYRLWIGGGGVYVGVSVVIACTAIGLFYRYAASRGWCRINLRGLLLFGLVVHLVEVMLFTQLPDAVVEQVMSNIALPLILTFTPATALLGLLLQDIETRAQTESALVESESRLALHLKNTPLACISWDLNFRCTQWNKAAQNIFGYTEAEAIGRHALGFIVAEGMGDKINEVFSSLLEQRGGSRNINENITRDGRTITCEWYNTPIIDRDGRAIGVASLCEDITEKRRAEEEVKLKNTLLIKQQETSLDGIFSVAQDGNVISMNQRFSEMWQLDKSSTSPQTLEEIFPQILRQIRNPERFRDIQEHLLSHQDESSHEEILLEDNRVIDTYSAPLSGPDNSNYGRIWWFRDISERKQAEELIWKQANFDFLTGLANRQMLIERLQQEIDQAERTNQRVALLFLDLDQFKDVNDTMGHDLGDQLLLETAQRLSGLVRKVDTVARLGGDEFTVVMGGLVDANSVERVANKLLSSLSKPYQLGMEIAYVTTSIGITFYPDDAKDVEEMIKNADQAMYVAKKKGRNRFQYFTATMQQQAQSRMLMISDLRQAILEHQFELHYQPIVALDSGAIHNGEALLRWQHPIRGMVPPDEFIPVAEETRLILEIGQWVFKEAVQQAARWRQEISEDFQVSINTSAVQYLDDRFSINDWVELLNTMQLPGHAIAVEITETLLMETFDQVTEKLLVFRDAGIQVSLDDFGTGYSSLAYLRKLDIDTLKVDRSFVSSLEPGSDDLALCEAIIVMAHKLGLKVVAEGIESEQQRELLLAAGCDYGQGFLFSKAVPASEFEKLLRQDNLLLKQFD